MSSKGQAERRAVQDLIRSGRAATRANLAAVGASQPGQPCDPRKTLDGTCDVGQVESQDTEILLET